MDRVKKLLLLNLRLLFFRATREDFDSFTSAHLIFGIFCTWMVGIGRWWDDPGANLLQHLGLGSVAYILVLAAVIWIIVLPLKPRAWSYKHVLTFVSLTSLPALLYAIPVERFLPIETAITTNIWFLGVVALWRVALYLFYLSRHAALNRFYTYVVGLLPLCAIVVTLLILNLHRVVFDIMGGLRENQPGAHDGEYGILFLLTTIASLGIIPLLLCYVASLIHARRSR
jgi:hypothetical protein